MAHQTREEKNSCSLLGVEKGERIELYLWTENLWGIVQKLPQDNRITSEFSYINCATKKYAFSFDCLSPFVANASTIHPQKEAHGSEIQLETVVHEDPHPCSYSLTRDINGGGAKQQKVRVHRTVRQGRYPACPIPFCDPGINLDLFWLFIEN